MGKKSQSWLLSYNNNWHQWNTLRFKNTCISTVLFVLPSKLPVRKGHHEHMLEMLQRSCSAGQWCQKIRESHWKSCLLKLIISVNLPWLIQCALQRQKAHYYKVQEILGSYSQLRKVTVVLVEPQILRTQRCICKLRNLWRKTSPFSAIIVTTWYQTPWPVVHILIMQTFEV